jgi:hypothetical protein
VYIAPTNEAGKYIDLCVRRLGCALAIHHQHTPEH